MAVKTKPSKSFMRHHVAIRWKDCIVVLSEANKRAIRLYNLWTQQWRKYDLPHGQRLPVCDNQRGVEIGSDIYIFDGYDVTNRLWKLTRSTKGSFSWNTVQIEDHTKTPSKRAWYSMWKYDEKMWIFGGYGAPIDRYLSDHGDFTTSGFRLNGYNNQLLSYDPFCQMWINVACSGDVPAPQSGASSIIINDKAYLHGGNNNRYIDDDLYELNMHSITWTRIETTGEKPRGACNTLLIPVTGNQLLLCGARGFIWIFDVHSHTWKGHLEKEIKLKEADTVITGLHGSAIILGEFYQSDSQAYSPVITVRLEPKSLQQLAMQMIYQKVDKTLWEILPKKLTRKMMGRE